MYRDKVWSKVSSKYINGNVNGLSYKDYERYYNEMAMLGYSPLEIMTEIERMKEVMEESKITVWHTVDKSGGFEHNHIENGWAEGDYPKPIKPEFTNQKAWKNLKWKKRFTYLLDGRVMPGDVGRE